jgi:hypothetical protein
MAGISSRNKEKGRGDSQEKEIGSREKVIRRIAS